MCVQGSRYLWCQTFCARFLLKLKRGRIGNKCKFENNAHRTFDPRNPRALCYVSPSQQVSCMLEAICREAVTLLCLQPPPPPTPLLYSFWAPKCGSWGESRVTDSSLSSDRGCVRANSRRRAEVSGLLNRFELPPAFKLISSPDVVGGGKRYTDKVHLLEWHIKQGVSLKINMALGPCLHPHQLR